MTFGAMAAWQAWLLIGAAAAAAAWIFQLKVRPPRVGVPSLLLWRRVFDRAGGPSWWERVRRAVSLAATVLVAVALAIAVTRPGPKFNGTSRGRVLIVLDSSWSMRARTSTGGTRWNRAVAGARALAQSSSGEDIALATTADGLVEGPTSDAALIETALGRLTPSGGEGTAWPRVDGVDSTHFFTDGALLRVIEPGTIVHSVYEPAPNVAITAFSARPATSSTTNGRAYLEITNFAAHVQTVHVTVTRETSVVLDRSVAIDPDEPLRQVITLDATGGARLRAHVSAPDDALDVDDDAVAWLTNADPLAVTVVSDTPDVWAALLRDMTDVRATFVKPANYRAKDADVVIFDRWLPAQAPSTPMLSVAPPTIAWLGRAGHEELTPHWAASTTTPILDGVDPFTLDITRARSYDAIALTPIATSEEGLALVSVLDSPTLRAVVLGFSMGESNLAHAPAFPVLVGNALEWLARPMAGDPRAPGPMALPASTTSVTAPDGADVPLVRAGDRVLVTLRTPGLYLVDDGGSQSVVGVNVGGPEIGNLLRTHLSVDQQRATADIGIVSRPWWLYGVLIAFAIATVEWWTWQRRLTV